MKLIKHYDFSTSTSLDSDWNVQVGEKWANHELQQYVSSKENLYFDNGLVLKATIENNIIKSARINTKNNFKFKYGKIDIIAKVPSGKGTWPAIWMMSQDNIHGHWPKSGEIDIMEYAANRLDELFFCIHTEAYNHRKEEQYYFTKIFPNVADDFHKYSLEWNKNEIIYFVDDKKVTQYTKGEDNKDTSWKGWPFDEEYYLILNLAIGGMFGGEVDRNCLPQEFIIKDVKVYQ